MEGVLPPFMWLLPSQTQGKKSSPLGAVGGYFWLGCCTIHCHCGIGEVKIRKEKKAAAGGPQSGFRGKKCGTR